MSLKDQRQALADTFINAIYLYDDKVLITFNYEDAKKQTLAKMGRIYDEILNRFQAASAVLHQFWDVFTKRSLTKRCGVTSE